MTNKVHSWAIIILLTAISAFSQTTQLTYQGRLNDGAAAANANYDFEFRLYDAGGTQIGATAVRNNVAVSSGIFTVNLDFGSGFPGADRFLEIGVRQTGGGGFTILNPRQRVNSSPYAIKSISSETATSATTATTANNALQLGGVAADQFVQTADPRLTDARPPTAGSVNYVQNTGVQQAASNFNVSGNGTAGGTLTGNAVNSATQYNIGGSRILSNPGTQNLFAGVGAGQANTTGFSNSFFGFDAGRNNTADNNAFFGTQSGQANTTGTTNTFVGASAGRINAAGSSNTFIGAVAGQSNVNGTNNSFVGRAAGAANTSSNNSFFGALAGSSNIGGQGNSFFGTNAGDASTEGDNNSFFGFLSGFRNTTGERNSFFGRSAGFENLTGSGNAFFGDGAGNKNTDAANNSFLGASAGFNTTTGAANVFVGSNTGSQNVAGANNTFVGGFTGQANLGGSNITLLGRSANVSADNLSFATAIGAGAVVGASNTVVLGRGSDTVQIPGNFNLTGSASGAAFDNFVDRTTAQTIGGNKTFTNTLSGNVVNAVSTFNIGATPVLNTAGTNNVFVGALAGDVNTGSNNAFVGRSAGAQNLGGGFNSFYGSSAGAANTGGDFNAFYGAAAGTTNGNGNRNSFFGRNSGRLNTTGSDNTFVGYQAGDANSTGSNNTAVGSGADINSGLSFATAIGAGAIATASNQVVLGRTGGADAVLIPGTVVLGTLPGGGSLDVCLNASNPFSPILSSCSSSLRYKTNINRFGLGLNLIKQLKPITFDWKDGGMHDLGLGAEDVAAAEPLLAIYDRDGQVEGVKYDRIGVVLVNAVKEQQAQIELQQKQIEEQRSENEALKARLAAVEGALMKIKARSGMQKPTR